jgi:hypothetical protein
MLRLALILALCTGCFRTSAHFYAPLFGPGPLTNLGVDEQANNNASLHALWALAIPLAGKAVCDRKGMWIAGGSWIAASLVSELWFHAPDNAGPGYAPEFRADLISRLLPTLVLLTVDYVVHR